MSSVSVKFGTDSLTAKKFPRRTWRKS